MPEPPADLSPETKEKLGAVKGNAATIGKAQADLPDAESTTGSARAAVP